MNKHDTVTLLLNRDGKICAVYALFEVAEAVKEGYNHNPFHGDGSFDMDAPYTIQTWVVQ